METITFAVKAMLILTAKTSIANIPHILATLYTASDFNIAHDGTRKAGYTKANEPAIPIIFDIESISTLTDFAKLHGFRVEYPAFQVVDIEDSEPDEDENWDTI
jgi:hypothetical protein